MCRASSIDRQRAAPAAAVQDGAVRSRGEPSRSLTAGHPGRLAQVGDHARAARRGSRSTSAAVVSRCSETRTLPCESTPIASSTCDGRQRVRGAGRAAGHGEAATVQLVQQRLAVDVQEGEGDQVRQPADRVADHLDVRDRRRHGRPDPVHQRPTGGRPPRWPPRRPARSEAAAATTAGTFSKPGVRPRSRSSAGSGETHRVPVRTTSTPTPGGPPHLCALADSSDQPAGTGTPAERLRGVGVQRHAGPGTGGGDLGDRLDGADLVVGGHQAGQGGAGRGDGGGERGRVDPAEPVDGHADRLAAGRDVPLGGVQDAGVLDRGVHQPAARAAPAGEAAEDGELRGLGPGGAEGHLVRAGAQHLGHGRRGRRRAAAGPAGRPRRAGPGPPSRRPARRAAPPGPPGAAAPPTRRRGRCRPRGDGTPAVPTPPAAQR